MQIYNIVKVHIAGQWSIVSAFTSIDDANDKVFMLRTEPNGDQYAYFVIPTELIGGEQN